MLPRFLLLVVLTAGAFTAPLRAATAPNIVFVLCDDLGYGDVRCLNQEGKIATPEYGPARRERHDFYGRSHEFRGLHADALWSAHRPLQLALATAERGAWRVEPAAHRARPHDGGFAAQGSRLPDGHASASGISAWIG